MTFDRKMMSPKRRAERGIGITELLLVFVIAFTLAYWFQTNVSIACGVEGSSMQPYLNAYEGITESEVIDTVYISKLASIKRGGVVVLTSEKAKTAKNPDGRIIKRVVGLPGDTLIFKVIDGGGGNVVQLYRRTKKDEAPVLLDETSDEFAADNGYRIKAPMQKSHMGSVAPDEEITVRPGCYFVLGDNRNNSSDSRLLGQIPAKNIEGKVFLVVRKGETYLGNLFKRIFGRAQVRYQVSGIKAQVRY